MRVAANGLGLGDVGAIAFRLLELKLKIVMLLMIIANVQKRYVKQRRKCNSPTKVDD